MFTLSKIITPESDDHSSILVSHLLISLRVNRFEDAVKYHKDLKNYISEKGITGFDHYKNDEILPILILIGKGNLKEAKKLKNKFEKSTNISALYRSLDKLPYTYSGGYNANIEKEIEEINKATDFLMSLPFYSYICYKFGENQKAIEAIDVLLKTYDNQGQVKDSSHYLLKQMYLLSDNSLTEALKLSNKTIMYDLKISKYDTIQSKLWHSIILYKNDKIDDAVKYFLASEYEFKSVNQLADLSLKFLLTPSLGIFPNEEIYRTFDEIEKLARN